MFNKELSAEARDPLLEGSDDGIGFSNRSKFRLQQKDVRRFGENIYCILFYLLLIVYILSCLMFYLYSKRLSSSLLPSQAIYGRIPKKLVTFQEDKRFDIDPFATKDNAWAGLIPLGKAHVVVKDPSRWELSGGFPLDSEFGSGAEEYTVSVFHQLHCLAALKSAFEAFYRQSNADSSVFTGHIHGKRKPFDHTYHCFDYLRQAIMCSGDTTLEKAIVEDGKVIADVDGWGVQHECRNYDYIFAWAEENRSNNLTGIRTND